MIDAVRDLYVRTEIYKILPENRIKAAFAFFEDAPYSITILPDQTNKISIDRVLSIYEANVIVDSFLSTLYNLGVVSQNSLMIALLDWPDEVKFKLSEVQLLSSVKARGYSIIDFNKRLKALSFDYPAFLSSVYNLVISGHELRVEDMLKSFDL